MAPPSGPRGTQGTGPAASVTPNGQASTSSPSRAGQPGDLAPPSDLELTSIRARYLGQKVDQKKPRLRKEGNKKFVFEWKADEDTSGAPPGWMDANNAGPGGTMLGGSLAGFDGSAKKEGAVPDKCVHVLS